MKQRMKQDARSKGDFICWCQKPFESLIQLRKHQEFLCAITIRRKLKELHDSIVEMRAECLAQREKDLRSWKKEKADGVVNM